MYYNCTLLPKKNHLKLKKKMWVSSHPPDVDDMTGRRGWKMPFCFSLFMPHGEKPRFRGFSRKAQGTAVPYPIEMLFFLCWKSIPKFISLYWIQSGSHSELLKAELYFSPLTCGKAIRHWIIWLAFFVFICLKYSPNPSEITALCGKALGKPHSSWSW